MIRRIGAAFVAIALLAGGTASARAQQSNAGDIPDSQVFVDYQSPLGFAVKVPEGWARSTTPSEARFVDHYDSVAVAVAHAPVAPTPASVRHDQQVALQSAGAHVTKVKAQNLPNGPAVMIAYQSTSAPNAVTGKTIKLENEQFLFWKGGKLATLTLSAPLGADNVDQWRLMSRSFQWK